MSGASTPERESESQREEVDRRGTRSVMQAGLSHEGFLFSAGRNGIGDAFARGVGEIGV